MVRAESKTADCDHSDFDGYCGHYLEQWEQRATIRYLKRTRFSAEAAQNELFPAGLQILLRHPEVIERGSDVRRRILARETATFMLQVAILEVDLITKLCIDFTQLGAGVSVPEAAKRVALTIATDEAYHAYVAREYLSDIKLHLDIEPWIDSSPSLVIALQELRRAAPVELERITETMALCFAENFVTEELFDLSKQATPKGPFHTMLREHMMDEGRHQLFFQRLFRHIWIMLPEEQRVALGRLIPIFLDGFLGGNNFEASQIATLEYVGYDSVTSKRIAREAISGAFGTQMPRKNRLTFMKNILNLVDVSGILEHAPTRRLMIDSGWADV